MTRISPNPLLSLAAFALAGSLAFGQESAPQAAPNPPAPAATPENSQPPAPIERHTVRPLHGPIGPGAPGSAIERFRGRHEDAMGGPMRFGFGGMWWKRPELVQRLNLTPDQVKRMDDIFQQSRIKLIDLKANVQKQEVLLEPMLSANPVDTAKAQAQIDRVADARAELEKANARMLLSIRGVLTPEQWTKLTERHVTGGRFGEAPGPVAAPAPGPHPSSLEKTEGADGPDFSI